MDLAHERARLSEADDEQGTDESPGGVFSPAWGTLLARSGSEAVESPGRQPVDLVSLEEASGEGPGLVASPLDPDTTVKFLEMLAETIETQGCFMRGHARRVAFYANLLAHRLMLPEEEHAGIRLGAFLHDLGKVGIPSNLLLQPSALDPEERTLMELHPVIGARLIEPLQVPADISTALLHHHEWWDGTGYPAGLAGEEIPVVARIIGIADAFDAMSADRPFWRALDRDVTMAELERFAGVQFDPSITREFLGILETGVCEIDPEHLADAVQDATRGPRATATRGMGFDAEATLLRGMI